MQKVDSHLSCGSSGGDYDPSDEDTSGNDETVMHTSSSGEDREDRRRKCHRRAPSSNNKRNAGAAPKSYSGGAPPTVGRKISHRPAFRTACAETDHTKGWDPATPFTTPCLNACPLMSLLDMYYCGLGIVCRPCKRIIPPGELLMHLRGKHRRVGGMGREADYELVEAHMLSTHRLTRASQHEWPEDISEPVEGIGSPVLSYGCPIHDCPTWRACVTSTPPGMVRISEFCQTTMIRQHGTNDHRKDFEKNPELKALFARDVTFERRRYVQRPYGPTRSAVLILREGWTPQHSPQTPPTSTFPILRTGQVLQPGAHFLQTLGYPQYVQSLKASDVRLRQLVRLPDRDSANKIVHLSTRHLELGLCDLYNVLPSYMQDADAWLDLKHPEVREGFVHK